MVITAAVLRESHAARNSELAQIGSTEVIEIIDGVKSIKFALWSRIYFVTIPQLASYFNRSTSEIRHSVRSSYKEEFNSDGVRCLTGQDSLDAHRAMNYGQNSSPIIICPAKSVLRLAIILSWDNDLAQKIVSHYAFRLNTKSNNRSNNDDLTAEIAKLSQIIADSQQQMLLTTQKLLNIVSTKTADVQTPNFVEASQDFPVFNDRSFCATELINNGSAEREYYDASLHSIDY